MHIELVEKLRCLRAHEESWLVASFDHMDDRSIVHGTLGCPICRAEYPIRDGVADFRLNAGTSGASPDALHSGVAHVASEEEVVRLAALLDLSVPGGIVVLDAPFASCAEQLLAFSPAHVVVLSDVRPHGASQEISVLRVDAALPLAAGSVRGIALGAHATIDFVEGVVRALTPRGRLVLAKEMPLPADVRELARDETLLVAEKTIATSPVIPLGRRRD